MIARRIHYCWFGGGSLPLQAKRCIASWGYFLPDYEVVCWDETNFDAESHPFTAAAYAAKRFAFVADYVRMYVLKAHGGIYLDVDVEVCSSFDAFLDGDLFIGLEDQRRFATAVIGAAAGHWLPSRMLEYYGRVQFDEEKLADLVNVNEVSRLLLARGFAGTGEDETRGAEHVLAVGRLANACDSKVKVRPIARHLYAGSWRTRGTKGILSRIARGVRKLPEQFTAWMAWKNYQVRSILRKALKR